MKLFIKNMVCDRCKMAVQQALEENKLSFNGIELGEVELVREPDESQLLKFKNSIEKIGFELIEDRNARTISKIKSVVLSSVRDGVARKKKLSVEISEALNKDYNSLSNLFSSVEGTTIENFAILQKIEYVKELLVYDELSLSEIANKLHYSSVQHLSNQFKKITGLTPSHFRKIGEQKRHPLDRL
ncbi:MAG TPA: AraC family transcriptional regulator [Cyclobacteriaceae bacterium]|nr:AraC family transcriptional regulator [Cyclobacteriaceae bacterium]